MTELSARGAVVVDTGVFSAELVRRGVGLANAYRPLLEGRPFIVSFVTAAEVRFGARHAGWGAPRLRRLEQRLGRARIVWPGPELVEVYADLRSSCMRDGHALGQRSTRPTVGSWRRRSGLAFLWSLMTGSFETSPAST